MPRRCAWAEANPLLAQYHDAEWGIPQHDPRVLWETLMLEGFQAGLSWLTVLRKRDALRRAFRDFAPAVVAGFTEPDIGRLLADPGIIRARAKIEATIAGARIYLDMERQGESFADFAWSFTSGRVIGGDGAAQPAATPLSQTVAKALKRRGFRFVGPTIVHAWMQAVGIVDGHTQDCFRRNASPPDPAGRGDARATTSGRSG